MRQNKGMKDDGLDPNSTAPQKLRWDLLPMKEAEEIVKVLTFGANKYTDNSWQQVEKRKERYYAALMRHISLWRQGEMIDSESELPHLSHAACNLIFLLYDMNQATEIVKVTLEDFGTPEELLNLHSENPSKNN